MWWDDSTISSTVNREYILANLDQDDHHHVDEPLRFGGGLTDGTYGEWIESKVPKLFLILVECGVQDQIFGVIDDSWDDDDLPVPADEIGRLRLTERRDEKLEQRLYQRQFVYLLKTIQKGDHLEYDYDEIVPIDCVDRKPTVVGQTHCNLDKVVVHGDDGTILLRKRIPLGSGPGQISREEYMAALEQLRMAEHKHVVALWASYIHQDHGYILLSPVHEGTLRSVIINMPPAIKLLEKKERQTVLLQWLHCLADALAYLHSRGVSHAAIRPSYIGLSKDNELFISSSGHLTGQDAPRGFDKEAYDFAAPEQWERPATASARVLTARPLTGSTVATRSGSFGAFNDFSSIHTSSTSSNNSSNSNFARIDSRQSDVFSLGCVFLEILTQLLKRTSKNFTSHRAAKNKTPGRGGGLPDSSFHKNSAQVESWIKLLGKDVSKKDDKLFSGIKPILGLIENMINPDPFLRPTSLEVRNKLGAILSNESGMESLCCSAKAPLWDTTPGITALRSTISSQSTEDSLVSPTSSYFPRSHTRSSSGNNTINTIGTARPSNFGHSLVPTRSPGSATISTARTITGDGREIMERRYASGGGRTAKPRPTPKTPKTKQRPAPFYAGEYSMLPVFRRVMIVIS